MLVNSPRTRLYQLEKHLLRDLTFIKMSTLKSNMFAFTVTFYQISGHLYFSLFKNCFSKILIHQFLL